MKTCTKCGQEKKLDEFPPNKRMRSGRGSWCRECVRRKSRESQRRKHGYKPRQPPGPTKRCPKCEQTFDRSEFQGRGWCRSCNAARVAEYTEANREHVNALRREARLRDPEKYRVRDRDRHKRDKTKRQDASLRRRFGIGLDDYERMLAEQNGGCAICGAAHTTIDKRTGQPQRLHIDHCHRTGQVRGLLCSNCNIGIGYFADDPDRLKKAAEYVSR